MILDETKRREWLRALRRFKYGIRVRAKLGVLQSACDTVTEERLHKSKWDQPAWEHQKWITLLYTSIRDNEYPPELLIGFAKSAEVTFMATSRQPTVEKTLLVVDKICARNSKVLRLMFGVFIP